MPNISRQLRNLRKDLKLTHSDLAIKKTMLSEREILMKTRGVFKYVTSCYYKDTYSTKNDLVQVGYLDTDNIIVFSEPNEDYVGNPDKLVRYLPGFWVRGYRSCEEYLPNLDVGGSGVEIREVISEYSIGYSPSIYSTSPKVPYSVIGYLDDDEALIYYDQIISPSN